MIDFILANLVRIFQLRRELPLAIHYFFIPPRLNRLPKEYTNENGAEPYLLSSLLGLENMSDKVIKDIRVKIPTKVLYDPIIEAPPWMTLHSWEFDRAVNEIKLSTIDPKEAAYIDIFPAPDDYKNFSKPRVIVDGQLITPSIERYGLIKKYPWKAAFFGSFCAFLIASFITLGYASYLAYLKGVDHDIIRQSMSPYSPNCHMVVLRGAEINEDRIMEDPLGIMIILQINKVSSVDQLLKKKEVIACKQN